MGVFSKAIAVFLIFSLVVTSDAVAIGFSCKYLLQNDFVAKTKDFTVRGFNFLRRNVRPSRLFYRNLDTAEVERIVNKYRGESRAIAKFEADLQARATAPDGKFTPEEFFALDVLRRPLEGRKLINDMVANQYVWVRKRFALQELLIKDKSRVSENSKKYLKRFSFPRRVAAKDFEYTTLSVVVAVAQADFANPTDLQVFAGPWKGFYEPLIDNWAKKNYPDIFSSEVFRSLYMTLAHNLFDNEATRSAWLLDFRDHLDHPEKLRGMLSDLSPGAKQAYEKTGEAGLVNYLINHEGTKRALFWFGRMLMMGIGMVMAGKTIAKLFNKNTLNLYKGQGLSTDDPNARQELMCDFTEEDANIENMTFDPTDPLLIGHVSFDARAPLKTSLPTPCDPQQKVMRLYVASHFTAPSENTVKDGTYMKALAAWRALIRQKWDDKKSGCTQYYHDQLRAQNDCTKPVDPNAGPAESQAQAGSGPGAASGAAGAGH